MLLLEVSRTRRHLTHYLLGLKVERLGRGLKHQVLARRRIVYSRSGLNRLGVVSLWSYILVLKHLRSDHRLALFVGGLNQRNFWLIEVVLRLECKMWLEARRVHRKPT